MLGFFKKGKESKTKESIFWNWFIKNKQSIEEFIDSENKDYYIFHKLRDKMKDYDSILFAELTKTEEKKYVLIITPDGDPKGIMQTKMLAEQRPDIENWVVEKFRQPQDGIVLNLNGVVFPSSDLEILPEISKEEEKVHVNIFIRDMNKDEKGYQHLAFLYLDHTLGEYNVLTRVGYIKFHHLDVDKSVENSISLLQLRILITEEFY